MQKKTLELIITIIACLILWANYFISPLGKDEWRTDNVNGYQFQEAPDYFKYLENKDITIFIIQELLIISTTILLIKGLGKKENE